MWFCDGRCCFVRTSRSVSLSPVTSRNRGDVGHSRFSVGSCLVSLQVLSMSFLVLWCRGWYGILNVSFLLVVVVVSLVLFVSSVCLGMRSALLFLLDESGWVASCREDVLECGYFCSEVGGR